MLRPIPRAAQTFDPPIMEARRWVEGVAFPANRPLVNVSQAAPVGAPPEALREAMAEMVLSDPAVHLYGPVLGLPALREEIAGRWSAAYGGVVRPDQVAVTAGCNQAYCAALSTLCDEGDEVVLVTPWYFNHKMWADMAGIAVRPLPAGAGMLPDPEGAAALIGPRTRAVVLVTPNNPGGAEYPGGLVRAFFELCRGRGIALVLDETYRDFDAREGAPHDLFAEPDWDRTLLHLYSFSKAYRLTGHRVGALLASPARLREAERFLDSVTICPPQLGQHAALWGMRHLGEWVAGERAEVLRRRAALRDGFGPLAGRGWAVAGLGAYFAYLRHPFAEGSDALARRLVAEAGVLLLPGTMFTPEGDAQGRAHVRVAFANLGVEGLGALVGRLAAVSLARPGGGV